MSFVGLLLCRVVVRWMSENYGVINNVDVLGTDRPGYHVVCSANEKNDARSRSLLIARHQKRLLRCLRHCGAFVTWQPDIRVLSV